MMIPQRTLEAMAADILALLDTVPNFGVEVAGLIEEDREELIAEIAHQIEETWHRLHDDA